MDEDIISQQKIKFIPVKDVNNCDSSKKKSDTWFLYFTIIAVSLKYLTAAASYTWASPVIPQIQSNDTSINPLLEPATTAQISLMMGLPNLFSLIGSFLAPMVSDVFGRKKTLQLFALFMLSCHIVIAFSDRMIYIIVSRCIFAVFDVGGSAIMYMYVVENCENHNRGKFASIVGMCSPVGALYGYLVGPWFSFRNLTLILNVPLVLWLLASVFTYDTPVYLLSKGKKEESLKALLKLRSNKTMSEIEKDLNEIEYSIKQRRCAKSATLTSFFKTRTCRVGLAIALIPSSLQFACGGPVLLSFISPIFNDAGTGLSGNSVAILIGTIKVVSVCLISIVAERFGRRSLLLFSSIGCALSLFTVGMLFYIKVESSIKWLVLVSIIVYYVIYSFGLCTIPNTVISELFSFEFRSVGLSILVTTVSFVKFVLFGGFPLLTESAGLHWGFWVFGIFCFVGAIGLYVTLPETKARDILDIQEELKIYKFKFKSRS